METPITLLVDFVSASQGGGEGELINASTGDIFGFICLFLLAVVFVFASLVIIRQNVYAKNAYGGGALILIEQWRNT